MKKEILQLSWQHLPLEFNEDVEYNGVYHHFTNLPLKRLIVTADTLGISLHQLLGLGFAVLLHGYFHVNEICIHSILNSLPLITTQYTFHDNILLTDLIKSAKKITPQINTMASDLSYLSLEIKTIKQKNLISLYYKSNLATVEIQDDVAKDYKKVLRIFEKKSLRIY